ncbi:hypothetical protein HYW58_02755 [Candidatus Kaiserbacteria bacterium]|nr:hypothetical protein [Candidatus Kaiserbacteria bacterium]
MKNDRYTPKEILLYLLVGGSIVVGVAYPVFLTPAIFLAHYLKKKDINKQNKDRLKSSFYYLKNKGYISIKKRNGKVIIGLSDRGIERAKIYKIQTKLNERRRKKVVWDGRWRVVIFDIRDSHKLKRDALRRVLQRSGFKLLQKSVWIYPFDCTEEISYVKDFFNIDDKECRILTVSDIGDDKDVRKEFGV